MTIDRIKDFRVFTVGQMRGELKEAEAITSITIEPTELVFVASAQGSMAAVSIVKKEMHYVYLDMGGRTYCTVAIPRENDDDDP